MEIEMANSLLSSFDMVACGVFMSLKFFYIVIADMLFGEKYALQKNINHKRKKWPGKSRRLYLASGLELGQQF